MILSSSLSKNNFNMLYTLHSSGFLGVHKMILSETIFFVAFNRISSLSSIHIKLLYDLLIFLPSIQGIFATFLFIISLGILIVFQKRLLNFCAISCAYSTCCF